jgi:hypothetical protein
MKTMLLLALSACAFAAAPAPPAAKPPAKPWAQRWREVKPYYETLFSRLDVNRDKALDPIEFSRLARTRKKAAAPLSAAKTQGRLAELFAAADDNHNKKLSRQEFLEQIEDRLDEIEDLHDHGRRP